MSEVGKKSISVADVSSCLRQTGSKRVVAKTEEEGVSLAGAHVSQR